jgi:hypothetical protein
MDYDVQNVSRHEGGDVPLRHLRDDRIRLSTWSCAYRAALRVDGGFTDYWAGGVTKVPRYFIVVRERVGAEQQ